MAFTSPRTSVASRSWGATLTHRTASAGSPTLRAKRGQSRRAASPAGAPTARPRRSAGRLTPWRRSEITASGGVLSTM